MNKNITYDWTKLAALDRRGPGTDPFTYNMNTIAINYIGRNISPQDQKRTGVRTSYPNFPKLWGWGSLK